MTTPTATLTDRYVAAATRWMPTDEARTLGLELRERIADTIDAKADDPDPERATLEELGDPLRLAADYRDRPTWLIGPSVYFMWLRTLIWLSLGISLVVGFISAVTTAMSTNDVGSIIGAGIGEGLSTAVHVAFWVTVTFVIVERVAGDAAGRTWTVDMLPASAEGRGSRVELLVSLAFVGLFLGALVWQHVASPISGDDGPIPLVDPGAWWPWLVLPVAALVVESVVTVRIHRHGWTWPAAWANLGFNAAFSIPVMRLLAEDRLLNPELVAHLDWSDDVQRVIAVSAIVTIALVSLWDTAVGFLKARSARP